MQCLCLIGWAECVGASRGLVTALLVGQHAAGCLSGCWGWHAGCFRLPLGTPERRRSNDMPRMPSDLNTPSPTGVMRGAGKELGGFKKFILRGNVVDLAVGVVIGAAFGTVIQALVKDIITPLLGLFGGRPDAAGLV